MVAEVLQAPQLFADDPQLLAAPRVLLASSQPEGPAEPGGA